MFTVGILLGQAAARLPILDLACNRCDRRGRPRSTRLVTKHSADLPIPELLRILSANCPRRQGVARDR